ncbi:hypothetical protein FWK35_00012863, partial [Aphis craccivora]
KNYKNTYAPYFLSAFKVQILTKIRQNHEYLQNYFVVENLIQDFYKFSLQ